MVTVREHRRIFGLKVRQALRSQQRLGIYSEPGFSVLIGRYDLDWLEFGPRVRDALRERS